MRPVLFSLGRLQVFAAPVFAGFASIAAACLAYRERAHARLSPERYWDLMLFLAVGTAAGGVLLYLVLWGGGLAGNLRFILRTHRMPGGAFYGNLLGAALASILAARRLRLPLRRVLDLVGLGAPLGLAVMRVGCFQNGCCFGEPTSLPWGVVFTDRRSAVYRRLLGVPLHPTQLYELAAAAVIFSIINWGVFPRLRAGRAPAGSAFLAFVALYGVTRFGLEGLRGGDPGVVILFGLRTAQLIAAATLAAAAAVWPRWRDEPA